MDQELPTAISEDQDLRKNGLRQVAATENLGNFSEDQDLRKKGLRLNGRAKSPSIFLVKTKT